MGRTSSLLARTAVVTLVALVGSLATASLPAGAATLGRDATRRSVERLVHTTYPDLTFGNVACPDGVAARRGSRFSCTVQLPGAFLVVDGVVGDSSRNVAFAGAQAVIPKHTLEQFVAANTSLPATVDCGPAPFRVARPGQVLVCSVALADGTTRRAEVTVADTAGNVTITGVT